jgi:S-DNA-T family DNA segregation ATPase FtsK/SpoIIIE
VIGKLMAKTINKDNSGIYKLSPKKRGLLGLLSGVLAVLVFIAIFNYDPSSFHVYPPTDSTPLLGQLGIFIARHLIGLFGLSAWILPWLLGTVSYLSFKKTSTRLKFIKLVTIFTSLICVSILANLRDSQFRIESNESLFDSNRFEHGAGGSVGAFFYSGLPIDSLDEERSGGFFKLWFGSLGTTIISIVVLLVCLSFHFKSVGLFNFISKLKLSSRFGKKLQTEDLSSSRDLSKGRGLLTNWLSKLSEKKPSDDLLFGDVSKISSTAVSSSGINPKENNFKKQPNTKKETKIEVIKPKHSDPIQIEEPEEDLVANPIEESVNIEVPESSPIGMEGFKVVRAAKTEKASDLFPERKGDYHFPSMELLMDPPEEEAVGDEDHILKAKRLQDTLKEFKIEVEMGEVHTGPVITRYDLHPAAGVRVEKIANLDKNLAMALRAESVRILAPVPGKGCVGIEVPNATPMPVCMKEILQSKAWHEAGAEIPIVLGKEASGRPLVADLTKMPHLLVAGSTGSGKTVCINAIIASLCYHSSPEDVRFIMVDPKIVEMKVYNDLPHMLIPVVTEPKKVPGALKWLLIEMERRYQIFSKIGVRNIAGFNAKILKDKAEKEKAQLLDADMTPEERAALTSVQVPRDDDALEIPENKLPYIVCIIDELADLMMVAQADVETGIARLAQLARAAGIHLIIATQRPSVNVITGVIKANLPSRISFRVASYRDSQTILDGKGAEALIGKGDMLFIPPGSSTFTRAQGAFVSDEEINGIVEFLKINGPPQIIEEVRDQIESAGEDDVLGSSEDSDDDPMTRKAIEVIRSTKRASTSNLQRKLSIGYNRAARIMDDLEDRGLVGPDVAGQGREILMDL